MYTSDVREETGAYSRFQEYSKLTKKARDWVYDIYIQKKESRSSNVDSDHLLLIYYSKKKKKPKSSFISVYIYSFSEMNLLYALVDSSFCQVTIPLHLLLRSRIWKTSLYRICEWEIERIFNFALRQIMNK